MDIKPITTPAEYRAALQEIDSLMAAKNGTPQGERLHALANLVVAYETRMDRAWLDMAPVGREFGSPDCDL
jgi:antitoxin component HigA of HigAB toxin-antitoxin module